MREQTTSGHSITDKNWDTKKQSNLFALDKAIRNQEGLESKVCFLPREDLFTAISDFSHFPSPTEVTTMLFMLYSNNGKGKSGKSISPLHFDNPWI